MEFTINKEPYDTGFKIYKKSKIDIKPGVSVLVGCNGAGKTTLLKSISESLEKQKILKMSYDNVSQGGLHQADAIFQFGGDPKYLATAMCSSEGEKINMNLGIFVSKIHNNIKKYKGEHKEFFIIADAIDSGLSIDNIVALKDVFELIIDDVKKRYGFETYILAVANEYELARNMNCFDVVSGKYVKFDGYEEYRSFILKSAKDKEKRSELFDEYLDKKERAKQDKKSKSGDRKLWLTERE